MKNMEKTMNESKLSYYDTRPWNGNGNHFLIRGFALHEKMPPVMIRHGEKRAYPWPWLFMSFTDSAFLRLETGERVPCGNTLMVWRPGQAHCYGNESAPWTHSWMIVDCPGLEELLHSRPIPLGRPEPIDASPIFEKYLPLLYGELTAGQKDEFYLKTVFQLFLYDLHRLAGNASARVPPRIREMEEYLARNLHRDLTVDTAAAHFGISAPHFSALFREFHHEGPMHYLNTLRMNRAVRLLTLSPYRCKEIAEMTGFRDPLYFSRKFHQFWGISPREYRNRNGEFLNTPPDETRTRLPDDRKK